MTRALATTFTCGAGLVLAFVFSLAIIMGAL